MNRNYYIYLKLFHRKLRLSDHGQLLLSLCCALLGLYIFFIFAIHSTAVTELCMLVAALLQYFFLVTFMAMAAEAINLYMKLVVVLGSKISRYSLKAAIVCWGKKNNCTLILRTIGNFQHQYYFILNKLIYINLIV